MQQADYRRVVVISFSLSGNTFHGEGRVAILDEGAFARIRQQCAGVISIKRYHNEYSVVSLLQLKQFSVHTVMSIVSTHQSLLNGIGEGVVKSSSLRG